MRRIKYSLANQINDKLKNTCYHNKVGEFIEDLEHWVGDCITDDDVLRMVSNKEYDVEYLILGIKENIDEYDILRSSYVKHSLNIEDLELTVAMEIVSKLWANNVELLEYV